MAEMHHIDDELMLAELQRVGQMMIQGGAAQGSNQGSQAGIPEERPASAMAGIVNGLKSLAQPGAGNLPEQ